MERAEQVRRGPGRLREERVTRSVLDAVAELVAERGMGALTMDAVAARAGVGKPAIYRRRPTKQDLVRPRPKSASPCGRPRSVGRGAESRRGRRARVGAARHSAKTSRSFASCAESRLDWISWA
ncbi:helix-turn-helix domain-containing protein [Streptomyces sp. LHD-70]|uniref:helix-turn-helix domain-containing protein n=1 Tax=Streptomyces sp. LHD-70 TaxID=3072140 RepID=UPI00280D81A2|nr:helix-turn-helix domain-containing protein [Streptomyces sp. LHD-70]MDQ8702571.1 helix-turn-helix domain-containing protein [Streptomyces sp. LHD-70]